MVRISKVAVDPKGRKRYLLYIAGAPDEEEPYMSVHEDLVVRYNLMAGRSIEEEDLRELVRADAVHRAYLLSLSYISRKMRTRHEIMQYLHRKEMDEETARLAVERLIQEKLVNDEQYAQMFVQQRHRQQRGRLLIKQELHQRGIKADEQPAAMALVTPDEELAAALAAVRKRTQSKFGADRAINTNQLMNFLMRRGFSSGIARTALRTVMQEREDPAADAYDADDDLY
jgi:regulatory protein